MKVVIDTCVIIDALQAREPFVSAASQLFQAEAENKINGFITAKSVTDIFYLTYRATHNTDKAKEIVSDLTMLFPIADTAAIDIQKALFSEMKDFEDAVMVETALRINAKCVITRNIKDYKKALISVYAPEEFIKLLL